MEPCPCANRAAFNRAMREAMNGELVLVPSSPLQGTPFDSASDPRQRIAQLAPIAEMSGTPRPPLSKPDAGCFAPLDKYDFVKEVCQEGAGKAEENPPLEKPSFTATSVLC